MNNSSQLNKVSFQQKFRQFFVYRNERKYVILCCNKKKENSRIMVISRESKDLDVKLDSFQMKLPGTSNSLGNTNPVPGEGPKKLERKRSSSSTNSQITKKKTKMIK
jgi:hypothetical protein